jgi:bifunctional non-homologous end joining protein LigD
VKHDGFRILAHKEGARVKVWSRRGADFADRFSMIAEAVRGLSADEALIDGDAVVFRPDGKSDFIALLTKAGGIKASLVAFDLLRLDGTDLRQRPLEARWEALARFVNGVGGVLFSEALTMEGATVFGKACDLGLEGIVSKRIGSLYRSGRCSGWRKCKNFAFVRT